MNFVSQFMNKMVTLGYSFMNTTQSFMNTTLSHSVMDTVTHNPFIKYMSWNTLFLFLSMSALSIYTFFILLYFMDVCMMCCDRNENPISVKRKRRTISDMPQLFTDGQLIRHTITKTWVGHYDAEYNGIIHNDTFYSSLGHFTTQHYKHDGEKTIRKDGWTECECETEDGLWVSTFDYDKNEK
jgi:hypothetical protein